MQFNMKHTIWKTKSLRLVSFMTQYNQFERNGWIDVLDRLSLILFNDTGGEKFRLTQLSMFSILNSFKTVVDWFYDESKNDLFVINEKRELMFNNDYNDLRILVSSDDNQHMEIRPCVDDSDIERGKEGVVIFINRAESVVVLERQEFESLYYVLSHFSFQDELLYLLQSEVLAVKANNGMSK